MGKSEVKSLIKDITTLKKKLWAFCDKLEDEKITPKTYRNFQDIVNFIEELSYDTDTLVEEVQETNELAEKIKLTAIQRVINELEEREERRHNMANQSFAENLLHFDGERFLDQYLGNITRDNASPISNEQVTNYVWELIAVDVVKYRREKKSLLELWTNDKPYCRWMMLKD